MLKWWKTNEKRTVLAVRPVDERTVQIIRKGPFLVECAVVVDGEAARRSALGLRGCRPVAGPPIEQSTRWQRRNLRLGLKLAPQGWL